MSFTVLILLVVLVVGGGAVYFFMSDKPDTENASADSKDDGKGRGESFGARRKEIQRAIRSFEGRQRIHPENPPFSIRLEQADLGWDMTRYIIVSGVVALSGSVLVMLTGFLAMAYSLMIGVACGAVLPYWFVNFKREKRKKAFTEALPDAIDIIVRGIRSGFPVAECIATVASETEDPLRSEFQRVIDLQQIGLSLGAACLKMYDNMPVQEANFFGIAISVQQATGGNLSEILSNLSVVLRDRRKMRNKIQAVSQEAKASAAIIGSLPPMVCLLLAYVSPEYMDPLWHTTAGHIILGIAVAMVLCGIFVMKRMINFEI